MMTNWLFENAWIKSLQDELILSIFLTVKTNIIIMYIENFGTITYFEKKRCIQVHVSILIK